MAWFIAQVPLTDQNRLADKYPRISQMDIFMIEKASYTGKDTRVFPTHQF